MVEIRKFILNTLQLFLENEIKISFNIWRGQLLGLWQVDCIYLVEDALSLGLCLAVGTIQSVVFIYFLLQIQLRGLG